MRGNRLTVAVNGIVVIPKGAFVEFEFDETRSVLNLAKHGIDFVTAQELWRDDRLLEVQARTTDERRWLVIGRIAGVAWSAVITYRDQPDSFDFGASCAR